MGQGGSPKDVVALVRGYLHKVAVTKHPRQGSSNNRHLFPPGPGG